MAFENDTNYFRLSTALIYVVGRAGVGKTSLISCLLTDRAQNVTWKHQMEDRVSLAERRHQVCTRIDLSLTKYHLIKGDSSIEITVREIDLTDSMSAACLDLSRSNNSTAEGERRDLIIYCTRMDETRYLNDDILLVTKLFGREIWENAIIALTFANRVAVDNPYGRRSADAKKFFDEEYQSWVETLFSSLREQARVDTTIVKIPILPTGTRQKLSLPTVKDWVSSFVAELWHVLLRENERLKRINVSDAEFDGTVVGRARAVVRRIAECTIGGVFGLNYFDTNIAKLDEVAEKDKLQHTYCFSKPE